MRVSVLFVLGACGRVGFDPLGGGHDDATDALGVAQVALGNAFTCVLSNRGEATCWGENSWGMLGTGDTKTRGDKPGQLGAALPPLQFGTGLTPRALVSKADYACAVLSNERAKCWGNNDGAQLGTGDYDSRGDDPGEMGDALPEVAVAPADKVSQVVVGHYHSCALIAGHVACWGKNDVDQNGYGDHMARDTTAQLGQLPMIDLGPDVIVQSVESLFNSTCVLTTDARVKCWGYNPDGALGLGDTTTRGGAPGEMGAALPFVDVGAGAITQLATGYGHACVVLDQRVKCWGGNSEGELGLGDTAHRGSGPNQMGDALPFVDLGANANVTAIAAGASFTCALLVTGAVKCWGENDHGQLGQGDRASRGVQANQMGDALPPIALADRARAIAAGGSHACAILVSGALQCWGGNYGGQLGLGDTSDRGDTPGELDRVLLATDLWP